MQVHLIDINVSAEINEHPSLRFQNIREKVSWTDTWMDVRTKLRHYKYPTTKNTQGITMERLSKIRKLTSRKRTYIILTLLNPTFL